MQELKPKHHSLTGRIDVRLMHDAFRSVKRNRGAAGVDRVSPGAPGFQANLEQNLLALMHDLKRGSFIPLPARRAYIDKGGGKLRPLGIPAVRDRVAQEVLRSRRAGIESALRLGLTLSAEKTKVTTFHEGFAFLGFDLKSQSCRMREKSVEKFKTRVRELTVRSHNLDAEVIGRLNAVLRGVANYFATTFSTCADQFRTLDRWVRMRLRCMKYKRKSGDDNWRLTNAVIRRMGLASLSDYVRPQRC